MKQFLQNQTYIRNCFLGFILLLLSVMISDSYAQSVACPTPPNPPVIKGSATAICRGELVQLTAEGCAGTVVWSTNDTLPQITVKPQRTTRYTAICRLRKGCISCFADVYTITVNTPNVPVISPQASIVCAKDPVVLTAQACTGTVGWSTGQTGSSLTVSASQTTSYLAYCQQAGCTSAPSAPALVQIDIPVKPIILADQADVCAGQSVKLTATGCTGQIKWSDGSNGASRFVTPQQTTSYRAVCQIGSCQSDSSEQRTIRVRSLAFKPDVLTIARNGCPFQTADLSRLIQESPAATLTGSWHFKNAPSVDAPALQSPTAVESGQYYLFFQNDNGCYSEPVAVTAIITPCPNGIPACVSNPARIIAWVDTLDNLHNMVRVKTQLRGSANTFSWKTNGNGLLVDPTALVTRYLFSDEDRRKGSVTFTVSTPDPDGNGPCQGAAATVTATIPGISTRTAEIVGLSKKVVDPTWLTNGEVELGYQLTVSNLGKNQLTDLQVSDNLTRAFVAQGATISSVTLRTDDGIRTNSTYTGQGSDTTLLAPKTTLAAGANRSIYLTIRINVSQANTLTFENVATVWASDVNGGICRDQSTNGTDPDPDHNGNPADNTEPTLITLQAIPTESSTVFIPEGFSPNGDGINDRFVIQQIPTGVSVDLEVFNRWGHVVYRSQNYKNDWDGIANQGIGVATSGSGLPEGTYFYVVRLSNGKEFARFLTLSR